MINFEQTLSTVMQLPFEQRQILINIVIHRDNDLCRREIAKEAREAIIDFHAGKFKPQPAKDIIAKLRLPKNEVTEI
ncbi:MAG: hypothetical protein DRQ49_19380 [Gammaproteobacteria bacterium]|nr:MAG: hypothetical protein DRQ49_19380 [Gammaproteobacteria bacterium]RKZ36766.1 MAG: hypothetical protein DRQ41_14070 [Gammaproteobacteria bacterium]